ncbi:hypothetical protein [Alcanivorax sediminis]|uniref:Uncharacterized protein n=1 Tax=Alcanivorax sediminis TaxID=2663008 RepID=A0A6N7LVW8_9GAMM|nr:hypothetical protein [Alcanivorax sediminis]MQX54587.1 hypothetical protein [Alcanivorax sediminis]
MVGFCKNLMLLLACLSVSSWSYAESYKIMRGHNFNLFHPDGYEVCEAVVRALEKLPPGLDPLCSLPDEGNEIQNLEWQAVDFSDDEGFWMGLLLKNNMKPSQGDSDLLVKEFKKGVSGGANIVSVDIEIEGESDPVKLYKYSFRDCKPGNYIKARDGGGRVYPAYRISGLEPYDFESFSGRAIDFFKYGNDYYTYTIGSNRVIVKSIVVSRDKFLDVQVCNLQK